MKIDFFSWIKKSSKGFILGILFTCVSAMGFAKDLEGIEFVDCNYDEIFYSLSLYSGIHISGDDTINGNGTFRNAGENFESAFDSFLISNRMYVFKDKEKWTVSKICISEDGGKIVLDANDVKPFLILEKLSGNFCIEISYDAFEDELISVHLRGNSVSEILNGICRQTGGNHEVEETLNGFHLARKKSSGYENGMGNNNFYNQNEYGFYGTGLENFSLQENNGKYSLDATSCSLKDILESLFNKENKSFVISFNVDSRVERISVKEKDFKETLDLLCQICEKQWIEDSGEFYVFDANTEGLFLKKDKVWKIHRLSYIEANEVISLIHEMYGSKEIYLLNGSNSFICFESEKMHEAFDELILSLDVKKESHPLELKFIKAENLLSCLPQGYSLSEFSKSTRDDLLYFCGSEERFFELKEYVVKIDVPVKRLSYDLLVMQYQYNGEDTWECKLGAGILGYGDSTGAGISLGSVLNFNLDVVSTFGYKFAASLQSAINENKAHIQADTKLYGVSGGKINFQNTNTYRYRDNNVDPETGKPLYSGVTRELVSGLKIDVSGWISGDGMITSTITASVSRQGTDVSSSTGNPPSSSEKIITTEVCGKSGEPIVLSGLLEMDEESSEGGVPFLSKIPVLGWLFKSKRKSNEKTELVIYLVPHWVDESIEEIIEGGNADATD